jgi:poly(A) polymerase Pap1
MVQSGSLVKNLGLMVSWGQVRVIVANVAGVYVGVMWHVMQATRARLQQCCQLLCCAQHHLQHQHVHVHQRGHRHRYCSFCYFSF